MKCPATNMPSKKQKSDSNRRGKVLTVLRKCALYVCLVVLVDAIGIEITTIMVGRDLFHYFTFLTLVQAGLMFLVGGALDLGGSLSFARLTKAKKDKSWTFDRHEREQLRAAPYIATGIALLGISFILAYPLK